MPNKREFKKYVNTVCDNVASDMAYAADTVEGADRDAIHAAIIDVIKAGATAIMKGNVKYDKSRKAFDNPRAYDVEKRRFFHGMYGKIYAEFADAVNAALAKFNAAVPHSK